MFTAINIFTLYLEKKFKIISTWKKKKNFPYTRVLDKSSWDIYNDKNSSFSLYVICLSLLFIIIISLCVCICELCICAFAYEKEQFDKMKQNEKQPFDFKSRH